MLPTVNHLYIKSLLLGSLSLVFSQTIILAEPIAPATDGTGTAVNQTGNTYNITGGQLSGDGANLFHSFQEFGLNAGQTANFISAPEINNILGRVTGGNASIINGLIQITGGNSNLFLINPAGLIFGPNATLNIPGDFTATTATGIGFSAGWFNAFGSNNYSALIGEPSAFAFSISQPGVILNEGNLTLNPEQNLTLLGGTVLNLGSLASPGGNITIAAVPGENLVRINQENHLLSLELPLCSTANCHNSANQPPQNFQPLDLPSLLTGGQVTHASHVTVNNDGTISLTGSTLRIPTDPGVAVASGNIDASDSSTYGNATGGTVAILGDKIALVDTNIDANGTNGGGTVLVGGEYQGQGKVPNASETFVNKNSLISANATENGDGGQVIIWADETTRFHGEISAQGGRQNGDGGLVEVSGKQNLIFRGDVDTSAPEGSTGSLLLDPDNITIANGSGGANDAEVTDGSIFGGDGTGDFTISETALEGLTNTDISLEATNNITIEDLSDNLLSLKTATGGLVTFRSDSDYDNTGDFSMNPADTIQTQGGAVNISRNQVTLGNIITNGGGVTVEGTTAIFNGNISTNGGDFSAAGTNGTNATVNGNINAGSGSIDFLFYSGGITIGSVTFTADKQIDINGTIFAAQPGIDNLIVKPSTSDRTIEITNGYMCSATTLCLGLTPFNAMQAAGFNSITIGRSDGTGKINMGGHSAVATIGSPTTIQAGTGTITITDRLNAQGNPLTLIADEIDVNSTISGTGSLTLQPSTVSQNIALGGTADTGAGSLDLTSTDFELIDGFSQVTIGRTDGTGTINTAGLVDFSPKTFDVTLNGGPLTFNNAMILRNNGILTLNTGSITSPGTGTDVTIGGTGNLVLNISGNVGESLNPLTTNLPKFNLNNISGNLFINNGQAIDLGAVNIPGNLGITASGNITDSGVVSVAGNSSFTTTETDATITLDRLSSTGSISLNTTGSNGNATVTNYTTVDLAVSNVGGALNVTATTGNITSSGTVTVGGNSSFTTSANGADITLDKLANTGTIAVNTNGSGADATIANSTAVNLAASSVGGGLNVTATTGGISTSGNVTAGSDITFTGDAIALNNFLTSPGNLILKPFNANTTIDIGGETGTFNLSAAEIANLSDGFSSITIGRSDGTGIANVGSISFTDPVTMRSGTGQLTVNGAITGTDNASVTINSSNIALNAGINTNNQNITIGGNTIIGSNITLDTGTGTGNIAFNGTVDGNQDLTLNAGTGTVSFAGAVGATTALNSLTVNSGISSGITATANNIAISGDVLSNGADVSLTAENQLTTNNITTSGGAINLTNNNGDVTSGNLNSSNPSGAGGAIAVNSPTGVVTTGNLTSTGTTGGTTTVQALTSITTSDINSSGTVGNGGNVLLDPENDIQVGFINAQGGPNGSGGNVDITTGKFFRATNTFTDKNGQVASISTAGGTGGGNITLTHDGGNQNTPFVVGDASTNGTAGAIATGASTMPLSSSFPGPTQQGNIELITAESAVTPEPGTTPTTPGTSPTTPGISTGQPGLPVAAAPTDNATVSPQLDSEPTPTNSRIPVAPASQAITEPLAIPSPAIAPETPVTQPGAIAPESAAVPSETPATDLGTAVSSPVISESSSVTPVSTEISTPSTPSGTPPEVPVASSISVAVPGSVAENGGDRVLSSTVLQPQETTAIATNLETTSATEQKPENIRDRRIETTLGDRTEELAMFDFGVAEIEAIFTQAFQIHLELSEVIRSLSLREAQTIIRRIDAETGVKPALLYVRFSPTSIEGTTDNDPLELLFVAPDGRPSRKVLSVTRGEVMATAENLNTYITAPRYRSRTSYLEPAQQLHQWLIAPVQKELDNHAIENLVLIMDVGLRSVPVAALHDGEHFLVEKYSLGIMPSLSLTDPRYRSIQNTSVLAMGASQFSDLNPLPAVPAEVQTITELRQGSFFLNEEFTLNNIQQQYAEKQPPIVHLATHGEFEPGDISHSYIQLWDQKLRLNDIRQLGFQDPAVELLVLSACQTAVGNEQAELGFAGMAVKAGVKTALASLWYVSDEGTFGLMTEFYNQLSIAPIKAEAMRQAQLAMINGNVEVVDGQLRGSRGSYPLPEALQNMESHKLTHPYYWSAFTLIGSPW